MEQGQLPEILLKLAVYVTESVLEQKLGFTAAQAADIGVAAARHVRRKWAGSKIYIPAFTDLSARDQAIWEAHLAGIPQVELARRHDLSEARICQILQSFRDGQSND